MTSSPTHAIRIWPQIELPLHHPVSGDSIETLGVAMPGSRVLARGRCGDRECLIDLPVGAAIKAPSLLDTESGQVIPKYFHTGWYAEQLREAYAARHQQIDIVPTVEVRRQHRDVVIVNCIDHLYGHCLLKLLNCQYHQQRDPETGICVLIQPQMRDLVPDYVAEIWTANIPLASGVHWYDSLDEWIRKRIQQYGAVSVSRAYSHLSNRYYDIREFAGARIQPIERLLHRSPIVHFSCRPDRCWGQDTEMQQRRLRKLYFQLRRRYQNLGFVVSGFGEPLNTPSGDPWYSGWTDLRVSTLDRQTEDLWISAMAASDLAVGVHGSNMLLPTALAASAVILLPLAKYDGIGLDLLMPPGELEAREELLNYACVYGDEDLVDVSPSTLARIIANKLGYSRINMEWFRFGPDYNDDSRLQSMLGDSEKVAAVHRVERLNPAGRLKRQLHRVCIRLAAAFE